jgi:hypothetical protein
MYLSMYTHNKNVESLVTKTKRLWKTDIINKNKRMNSENEKTDCKNKKTWGYCEWFQEAQIC